jgi:site-specific DNA recombinase
MPYRGYLYSRQMIGAHMTQIAIAYGRNSFDDPENRTSSVADQEMFARAYAQSHGFNLVQFFGDNGITGATIVRPGLQQALAFLEAGKASILMIEDVDRLGRDQEHLAFIRKRLTAFNVALHTVVAGKIDDLTFSFKSIISEQQRARIAHTTRRGLRAKATRGGVTGGKTLGYKRQTTGLQADGSPQDCLEIVPEEAQLIRRIYELYASGKSLKAICKTLNDEGIPSPRAREAGKYNGGKWNPTTLSGDPAMGEGILNNESYIGRRIFNRRTWVEIPTEDRGFKRIPRLNPKELWVINEDENLRIIEQDLWDNVKRQQAEAREIRDRQFSKTGNPLSGAKRAQHLLSGLVVCGGCGENYVSAGGRWRCKRSQGGACDNASISGTELEQRALSGLQDRLLTPEIITRFAGHLQKELDAKHRASHGRRDELTAALRDTKNRSAKILKRIEEVNRPGFTGG